jgi:transcriptional regulator with XRE-family HTH domain
MSSDFTLDLRVQRRKTGYRQKDCAHLVGITTGTLSAIEMGRRRPTLEEICTLSVIYGRTFESFFGEVMEEVKANLRTRILTMPKNTRTYAGTLNRDKSIERLARRLAEETAGDAPD